MQIKRTALITGGGSGQRMGSDVPKQFLLLQGRPVIFHTIEKFAGLTDQIILVLPRSQFSYWDQLCLQFNFNVKVTLVPGGNTRTQSVMNGLTHAGDEGVIAIHDAVRPLVTPMLIEAAYRISELNGSAVPVIPVRETLRLRKDITTEHVNREDFVVVQTPQCFDLKAIKFAYQQHSTESYSDDAGVFEKSGNTIYTVEGETTNIKITYKEDLAIAEAILGAVSDR